MKFLHAYYRPHTDGFRLIVTELITTPRDEKNFRKRNSSAEEIREECFSE